MMTRKSSPFKVVSAVGTVLRTAILVLLFALLGVDIYVIQSTVFLHDAMPMPFGYGASVVLSGSMEPALSPNDLIFVREEPTYAVGDMIVFRDGNAFTVHRLKAVDGETFVTRGDANDIDDSPITAADVKGKVVGRLKGAGKLVAAARSPIGIAVLVAVAVALFEAPYVSRERKKRRELAEIRAEIEKLKE